MVAHLLEERELPCSPDPGGVVADVQWQWLGHLQMLQWLLYKQKHPVRQAPTANTN